MIGPDVAMDSVRDWARNILLSGEHPEIFRSGAHNYRRFRLNIQAPPSQTGCGVYGCRPSLLPQRLLTASLQPRSVHCDTVREKVSAIPSEGERRNCLKYM
ncbi:hypothetical protein SKAU_G00395250 [Synaphobranchus kaupii]|uniref:Uncharacterized protein n=1 Tax=Synaphobranchus kaupii TaxID=118154 RepID=A0A9Q1IDZ8_SYNKA|nr:hypothetical protein SKAU_G00395250 [Synaphobranchus kaupii]